VSLAARSVPIVGVTWAPETRAALAAMTVQPTYAQGRDYNTLIQGLKQDGLWTRGDVLQLYVAHDEQAARVDIRNPSRVATAVNAPTWAVNTGYTPDGSTNYVNSNFTPSTDAVALTGSSGSIAVWEGSNVSTSSAAAGAAPGSSQTIRIDPRTNTNASRGGMNSSVSPASTATTTDSRGLSGFNRSGTTYTLWKAGTLFDTVVPSSNGPSIPNIPIFVGGYNNAGSLGSARAATQRLLWVGASLDATQWAALYARLLTYLTARNAA